METKEIALSSIAENAENPRTITSEKFNKLVKSLLVFPRMLTIRPIVIDETKTVLGGNMRLKALKHIVTMDEDTMRLTISENEQFTQTEVDNLIGYWLDWRKKPTATIVSAADLTEAQKREFIIKDNVGFGDWDTDMLANAWDTEQLKDWGMEDWQFGIEGDSLKNEENENVSKKANALEKRFLIPPFSVLDTRRGNWIKRENYWKSMGIASELGRKEKCTYHNGAQSPEIYDLRNEMRKKNGYDPTWKEIEEEAEKRGKYYSKGTSIFSPTLCECAYRWFMHEGGKYILDPFCGGSVRGIVAAKLGFEYFGRDLREEQIEANEANAKEVCGDGLKPSYSIGDSQYIGEVYESEKADLLFSCPPYADLEVYSKDPADISNMPYDKFLDVYRKIISESCKCLHNDRFAVWVVSEVRSKKGEYYNFVSDTIKAFKDAGLHYYNEMILVNQVASSAIRVTIPFQKSRKVGRLHQNVLVFYKGDLKSIIGGYPQLDLSYLQEEMQENIDEDELSE